MPSIEQPITPPSTVARSACFSDRPRYDAETRTRIEMPKFVQSRNVSAVPRTRSRSGTGSIPQFGVSIAARASLPTAPLRAARERGALAQLDLVASLELDAHAMRHDERSERQNDREHAEDPDERLVRNPEGHVQPVRSARDEDDEHPREQRGADGGAPRCVARAAEHDVEAVVAQCPALDRRPEEE